MSHTHRQINEYVKVKAQSKIRLNKWLYHLSLLIPRQLRGLFFCVYMTDLLIDCKLLKSRLCFNILFYPLWHLLQNFNQKAVWVLQLWATCWLAFCVLHFVVTSLSSLLFQCQLTLHSLMGVGFTCPVAVIMTLILFLSLSILVHLPIFPNQLL